MIEIVPFRPEHATAFAELNRAWLDDFGIYEEADGKHLYSPRDSILSNGGEIHIAEEQGRVVGTVALVRVSSREFELAKLAVSPETRGTGLGRRLAELAVRRARELGADRVVLSSSSKLSAALKLYESLGFQYLVPPTDSPYSTADIYMSLELAADAGSWTPPSST